MPPLESPAVLQHEERRRHPRYPLDASLEMEWGSSILKGRVRDISADGMSIEMADPLWVGARFLASIELDTPLRVECVVRRIDPGKGMGVTLAAQSIEERARLAALLESLERK